MIQKEIYFSFVEMLSPRFTRGGISQTLATRRMGLLENPIQTLASPSLKTAEGPIIPGLTTEVSKTYLGPYRMGETDGSSAPSAIPMPYDIFPPNPRSLDGRKAVTFENIGNNTFQPQNQDAALHALISRLGEQKFKAKENEKYAAYQAIKKLEREIAEVEKTASPSDLGLSREIVRSAVEERRKINEDDFLRRMLDSGLSVEDANDELENVRRANALQEARTVEDRSYQAKILLTRIAKSRGLMSSVNEPLTQSGPIMNPQPNDMMATAAGNPADGFGNAPLDVNRQYLTPAWYASRLRKSRLTQEQGDRDAALATAIAGGEIPNSMSSEALLSARERELALENAREQVAARAEQLRIRPQRLLVPLPISLYCENVISAIYNKIDKNNGDLVRASTKLVQDANKTELLLGINIWLNSGDGSIEELRDAIKETLPNSANAPVPPVTEEYLHNLFKKVANVEYFTFPVIQVPERQMFLQQQLNNENAAFGRLSAGRVEELRRKRRRNKTRRAGREPEPEAPAPQGGGVVAPVGGITLRGQNFASPDALPTGKEEAFTFIRGLTEPDIQAMTGVDGEEYAQKLLSNAKFIGTGTGPSKSAKLRVLADLPSVGVSAPSFSAPEVRRLGVPSLRRLGQKLGIANFATKSGKDLKTEIIAMVS
jgi:hypothetical protein